MDLVISDVEGEEQLMSSTPLLSPLLTFSPDIGGVGGSR